MNATPKLPRCYSLGNFFGSIHRLAQYEWPCNTPNLATLRSSWAQTHASLDPTTIAEHAGPIVGKSRSSVTQRPCILCSRLRSRTRHARSRRWIRCRTHISRARTHAMASALGHRQRACVKPIRSPFRWMLARCQALIRIACLGAVTAYAG